MGGNKDRMKAGACGLRDIEAGVFIWTERKVNPPLTRTKCQGPLMLWRQEENLWEAGRGLSKPGPAVFLVPTE